MIHPTTGSIIAPEVGEWQKMEQQSDGRNGPAFIFDLDGVIIDSNPVHREVWRAYLERCGIEVPTGFDERMYGRRNDEIVRDLFGTQLADGEVFRHGAAKEALYREIIGPVLGQRLLPGVRDFLNRHRGRPMAVASNAEPENVRFVLENAGLLEYFEVVMDGHQVERPKPDPEIYLRTAERLGARPADCIVFEDSPAGVKAARAAGMRVVGIESTYNRLEGIDFATEDFDRPELEKWLRNNSAC